MSGSARLRRIVAVVLISSMLLAVALLFPQWWQRVRAMPPWPVPAARLQRAQAALPQLPVVTPRELDDYDRDFFGPAWTDVDGNGCDTRNDVLAAWLQDQHQEQANPCVVLSGTLADPYTGHVIHFQRGPETSRAIEIDHVVALADAWRKGAWQWSASSALEFANDPANLIPVDGQANQRKGADDAASWLPPNEGFRCAYVVVQIVVKSAYGIGVSASELTALGSVLDDCEPAPHGATSLDTPGHLASTARRGVPHGAGNGGVGLIRRRCQCRPLRSQRCIR